MHYGAIVIGAGAAGCSAALEASMLGMDVLLVDAAPLPGQGSLARGALDMAVLRDAIGAARDPGHGKLDPSALLDRRRTVLRRHVGRMSRRLREAGVRFERGHASLRGPNEVFVEGHGTRRAEKVVIATGSRPRRPPRFPFDHRVVCDSDSIFRGAGARLRSLVIVGAEVEGCEFACLFAALGASVTLVERRRRLLRCADPDILEVLHREMQSLGVVVALEEEVEKLEVRRHQDEPHAVVQLASGRQEVCDRLLVLAGREPCTDAADLRRVGIDFDARGFIQVDECFQTRLPGVYAVGDVVGPPMRASVGIRQGRAAAQHAAGHRPAPITDAPLAAHTIPEIAVVGLIEEALKRLDIPYGVGKVDFSELLRAEIAGNVRGLMKIVFERGEHRLLGVQIIGPSASELLPLGAAMIQAGATIDQLADVAFSHPSLSEAYRAAALDGLASSQQRPPARVVGGGQARANTRCADTDGCL
jgi:NAD(P) transhydrogenase